MQSEPSVQEMLASIRVGLRELGDAGSGLSEEMQGALLEEAVRALVKADQAIWLLVDEAGVKEGE